MIRRPLSPVDICSHDVYEQAIPHEAFARLRREMPVAWHEEPDGNAGFWAVTRWADLVTVHRDHQTFSSQVGGTELEELERDPEAREARRTMLETDPPEHTGLRRMVSRNFTRRSMDGWTGAARELTARIFDEALPADRGQRRRGRGGVRERRGPPAAGPDDQSHPRGARRGHGQPLRVGRQDHLPRRSRLLRGGLRQGGHRPVSPAALPQPRLDEGLRLRRPARRRQAPPSG